MRRLPEPCFSQVVEACVAQTGTRPVALGAVRRRRSEAGTSGVRASAAGESYHGRPGDGQLVWYRNDSEVLSP